MNRFQRFAANLLRIPTSKTVRRGYAAGGNNGTGLSGWMTPQSSADSELWHSIRLLIARSRALYQDDSNVQSVMGELVATVVDDGLKLQSKVKRRRGQGLDLALNQRIEEAFHCWADNPEWCDVAGKHNFWQMQAIVQHSRLVDGGVLVRIVNQRFGDSPIAFALELMDVDLLDDRISVVNRGQNQIKMGVEVNDWNRAIAYWLFEDHPGDIWNIRGNFYYSRPVPASEIIHVFNRNGVRPGQTRGTPALHAAILKARNLLGFEESELIKARIQACVTAFVESEYPDAEPLGTDDAGYPLKELFPGAIEYLDPGQKLAAFDPSSPNPNAPAFIKHFQRAIARVLGMSSYSVTGDLSDANYSSLREGKNSEWRRIRIMRNQLADDFCNPVFRRWMEAAVRGGLLRLPTDFEFNQHFYCSAKWFGRPMPQVDPLKDVNSLKTELEIGTKTLTEILAERGIDFTDWCEIKAQEKAIAEQYGIQLAPVEESPALPPEEVEDDDEQPEIVPPSDGDRLLDSPPKRVPRKQKKRQKWRG